MNLVTAFARSAHEHARKTALYWGDAEFTFSDLAQRAAYAAFCLQNRFNVKPGDRVGLWLENCPEFIPAFLGILRAGAAAVPINSFLKPEEVNYILADAGIDVLFTDADLGSHHRALEAARPNLKLFPGAMLAGEMPDLSHAAVGRKPSDLAALIYTSGTTGHPKGAMLSHGNLLHNVESCRRVLETVPADRFGVLLPLFHSYMLTVGMLLPLIAGGSIILVKSLHPVKNVLEELVTRQASILPAIPQFYRSLVNIPGHLELPIRVFISGAAPLPKKVIEEFEAKFRRPLIEGYGLSEASPVVSKNPIHGKRKAGSVGLPIPNVEVSIQDDQGRRLPPHHVGEVCVRGGNVMLGYWNNPEETAKTFRGEWLLTGDIGYLDSEGYLYITDRKKDMLLVNGINVYPREIDEVIYHFPGIREAAVIGKPDVRRGEKPVAFVSLNAGVQVDTRELQLFLKRKLADYKIPQCITILPALPRNGTGKILKTALRALPLPQ